MSFRGAPCIAFCLDPHCDRSFEWIRDEQHPHIASDIVLPCGHKIGTICFSDGSLKTAHNAELMLDYLLNNDMVKSAAFDIIEQHGGVLDDALNCIPPKDKPTQEELEELEEY